MQKSISHIISQLQEINIDNNFEYFFRGNDSTVENILPRIYRIKEIDVPIPVKAPPNNLDIDWYWSSQQTRTTIIDNENKIFREIILRSPQDFVNEATAIEKLVKMQHYGLPTRLLDITANPLVALYFACFETDNSRNGEIVVFKVHKDSVKFYDSDTVSILSNISKMPSNFTLPFDDKEELNNSEEILPLLHEIRSEKPQFSNVIEPKHINEVLLVRVKLNNDRIIRQSGAFLLFGMNKNKKTPATINPKWIYEKIAIPYDSKAQLKKELLALGISESTLFPEIEYQAKRIIELYEYALT